MMARRIEIIGGGLAGLALGLGLRRAGVPVTVHEASNYPRHRVCGEFITGLSTSTLEALGIEPLLSDALRHHEVAWSVGGQPPHVQRLPSPALGISRFLLDARLAEAFINAGGQLVTQSRQTDHRNAGGRVFAIGRRPARDPQWIGLKVHVAGLPLVRDLEMHLGGHCYVGLARVEDGAVNVCGLFRRRGLRAAGPDLLLGYLRAAGLETLATRIAHAEVQPGSFCAVAALGFDRYVRVDHRICLGDAGAMIPPFTGNGMAMALQSAEIAMPGLLAYVRGQIDWPAACRVTAMALRRQFRVRLASADLLHPFLLRPRRQRWFAALGRANLLPFRSLYATLH
jgi:2-polyprenyl-6-methoxyphenol hydroxylase-like FAD-dependent oxidoreductase